MLKSDELAGKLDLLVRAFKSDNNTLNSKECKDVVPVSGTSQFAHSGLDGKLGEFFYSCYTNRFHHSLGHDLSNAIVMLPEANEPVDVKTASNGAFYVCEERSTSENVFLITGSVGYDGNPKIECPTKSGIFENEQFGLLCHSFPDRELKEQLDSHVDSRLSSPALEHMKISFQPINGFGTSKMKLR
ncbi:hypothetical protein Nepgr_007349 [Nepenthes gracilis]|uniref:Uncharacterized protein n=1 Tax=Nepenthes gracilis TaxID=150966 RepID=A0AAD3S6Y6_NEPGR|nr:hypothetical protein Nepgr_007349 [Nepenthes gracilis]